MSVPYSYGLENYRRFILKAVVKDIKVAQRQICQQHFSLIRDNRMFDAVDTIRGVGISPVVKSIMLHKLIHQTLERDVLTLLV